LRVQSGTDDSFDKIIEELDPLLRDKNQFVLGSDGWPRGRRQSLRSELSKARADRQAPFGQTDLR